MRTTPLVLSLLLACGGVAAQAHTHSHAPPAAAAVPAQHHATDAVLRTHMHGIRTAVDALEHYEHGHMGPDQARVLAAGIQGHVRDIVANCKLPPAADAALHAIIAPLSRHASALEKDPKDLAAIAPMREALAAYARQFDDPETAAAD